MLGPGGQNFQSTGCNTIIIKTNITPQSYWFHNDCDLLSPSFHSIVLLLHQLMGLGPMDWELSNIYCVIVRVMQHTRIKFSPRANN